jgi:hypothetical protein
MGTNDIDSKIDGIANKAKLTAAKVHDESSVAARKGTDVVRKVEASVEVVVKKVGDRVQETAEKAGHVAQELASKTVHAAHEITQKVAHAVKETATKAEHRGHGLVDKAGDKTTKR